MEQDELLRRVVETLERLNLTYLVTGSIATILYGEPRFTNDIDIVLQLPPHRVAEFVESFSPDEFYVDADQARSAAARRGQFNIIHPASGLKVDVMIPTMDEFDQSRFARAKTVRPAEHQIPRIKTSSEASPPNGWRRPEIESSHRWEDSAKLGLCESSLTSQGKLASQPSPQTGCRRPEIESSHRWEDSRTDESDSSVPFLSS